MAETQLSPSEILTRLASAYLPDSPHTYRYSHPIINVVPDLWRVDKMGASVYAQFTTPFEIKDAGLSGYKPYAYLRLPQDPAYTSATVDRKSRGWIVLRSRAGIELFRADVNLFMDGGVGVLAEDSVKLSEALIEFGARYGGRPDMPVADKSMEVIEAVLQRLEAMHSPWAQVVLNSAMNGVSCFHESIHGTRTAERYVVDLRLTRG